MDGKNECSLCWSLENRASISSALVADPHVSLRVSGLLRPLLLIYFVRLQWPTTLHCSSYTYNSPGVSSLLSRRELWSRKLMITRYSRSFSIRQSYQRSIQKKLACHHSIRPLGTCRDYIDTRTNGSQGPPFPAACLSPASYSRGRGRVFSQ